VQIQDQKQKQDIGLVESGNMKINEIVQHDIFFEMDPSRRGFLKKLGKGAMGVGAAAAMSMLPKGAAKASDKLPMDQILKVIPTLDKRITKAIYKGTADGMVNPTVIIIGDWPMDNPNGRKVAGAFGDIFVKHSAEPVKFLQLKNARGEMWGGVIVNMEESKVNESALITEEEFEQLAEKQDACYHKVKARYKVWPSAYASGALVQCRKKGAANWGNKSKK